MENPFEYPDDRSELFEPENEEEAHFYFTIADFENLISKYGTNLVMNRLSPEILLNIMDWCDPDMFEEPIDWRSENEV